jgi:dipeptidyl aminopeptidase/acylaminoacyl peptidase
LLARNPRGIGYHVHGNSATLAGGANLDGSTLFLIYIMHRMTRFLSHWSLIAAQLFIMSASAPGQTKSVVTPGPIETTAAESRAMQLEDLFRLDRFADPQCSPDGTRFVFQATRFSDPAKNAKSTQLWLSEQGAVPEQITRSLKSDSHPRFSPDGKRILFESNRDGSSQLYILDTTRVGEARKLTNISTGASTGIWSPDGSQIAFVSSVRPEWSHLPFAESDAKNRAADEETASNPVKAKTFTKLFYRHWDAYTEDKRQHVFVIQADGSRCMDATPGDRDAYPTSTTFSVGDDFCFTPDGQHLLVTAVPAAGESWSTNYDLCRIDLSQPSPRWESLTDQPAADCTPKFSPNGKRLAYRAQARPGYEADKWNIVVVDCKPDGMVSGQPVLPTADLDRSVADFVWLDDTTLVFTTDDSGSSGLYRVSVDGKPEKVALRFGDGRTGQISAMHVAGGKMVIARSTMNRPAELYTASTSQLNAWTRLTTSNDAVAQSIVQIPPEIVQVDVEGVVDMQMWILKPPGFDPKKKWPVVYLIHGGPQGAWEDGWSFRWNPQIWAAQGYVVALPNPRGSTGFGQQFCDEISGDWGGKCYRDLVAGLKHLKSLSYVDRDRIGSAGASFGGYMQDWFAVNEIAKDLRCLISHCSVYNFESMWGTTDELWFDEFEHGGLPWEIPGKYREFSPHTRAGKLGEYKTPMLVIHNDLDFRCPIGQGHELFQALQRQGVPSRFLNFPDEGHWVSKSANSLHWHREVFAWLTKYCPPGGQ